MENGLRFIVSDLDYVFAAFAKEIDAIDYCKRMASFYGPIMVRDSFSYCTVKTFDHLGNEIDQESFLKACGR